MFGEPIKLTFDGKTSIKSRIGGFLSIGVTFFIIVLLYTKINSMFDPSNLMINNSYHFFSKMASNGEYLRLKDNGITTNDLKFGVNLPPNMKEEEFDNSANKYMVYRAAIIDSNDKIIKYVEILECLKSGEK